MNVHNAPARVRSSLICLLALVGIFFTAPWPSLQAVFHVALVLGLAPLQPVPLMAGLWAVAAGWVVEGTLRMVPHPGGAAWVDLTLTLTRTDLSGSALNDQTRRVVVAKTGRARTCRPSTDTSCTVSASQ